MTKNRIFLFQWQLLSNWLSEALQNMSIYDDHYFDLAYIAYIFSFIVNIMNKIHVPVFNIW